jgi:uncharacterized membrane protein YciS (DUF1049 family)
MYRLKTFFAWLIKEFFYFQKRDKISKQARELMKSGKSIVAIEVHDEKAR